MTILCPQCNHSNDPNAKFCNQCGEKLILKDNTTTNIVGKFDYDEMIEAYEELPAPLKELEDSGQRAALYLFGNDKVFSLEGKSEFIL